MRIASIGNSSSKNVNFRQNKKDSALKKAIPSAKSAILCSALLYPALLQAPKINRYGNVKSLIASEETENLRKNNFDSVQREKFSWDNIPDYKKLTGLFYTSLVLMLLINIMTYKDDRSNSDNIDDD